MRILMWLALALTLGAAMTAALLARTVTPPALVVAAAALSATITATRDRRGASAGSRLHARIVITIALVAAATGAGLAAGRWQRTTLPVEVVGQFVRLTGIISRVIDDTAFVLQAPLSDAPAAPTYAIRVDVARGGGFAACERVAVAGVLERPRSPTNPGAFDYAVYCRANGIAGTLFAGGVLRLAPPTGLHRLTNLPAVLATRIRAVIARLVPAPRAALLSGLVFGAGSDELPVDMSNAFRRAGVLHLLAASGSNVAFVLGAAHWLLRRWLLTRPATSVGLGVIWVYWLMTGGGASISRAAVMATIVLAARLLRRDPDGLTSLAFAAAVLTFGNPLVALDAGFLLSFGATWGILALTRPLAARLERLMPASLALALAVTLAAQAGVLPVALAQFGEQSLIAPLTNLVLLPLTGAVVVAGALAGGLGALWLPLGLPAAALADLMLRAMLAVIGWLAALPWATVVLPALPLWWAAVWYAWLARLAAGAGSGLGRQSRPGRRGRQLAAAALALAFVWAILRPPDTGPGAGLIITFIDVGQGDSALVELPDGRRLLVDCGDSANAAAERAILPFLRWANVRRLTAVLLTHDHADHTGGLPALRRAVAVGQVLSPADLTAGQGLSGDGAVLSVLWPPSPTPAADNDASLVLRLSYAGRSALLCGDIEAGAEARLAGRLAAGHASDVLKVAHHGGQNSSTAAFLAAVRPQLAVISVGAGNRFGHPALPTLARLVAAGAQVLRTDEDGAIRVALDEAGVSVWRWDGRRWRAIATGSAATGAPASVANTSSHGLHCSQ